MYHEISRGRDYFRDIQCISRVYILTCQDSCPNANGGAMDQIEHPAPVEVERRQYITYIFIFK